MTSSNSCSLHTFNTSPREQALMHTCCQAMAATDALLLLENGVYWLRPQAFEKIRHLKVYALIPDLQARGLQAPDSVIPIDDAGFVALCVEYNKVVSWF
ncbi:sulfurtransferase complex subunit TusB [Nitrincola tapanii]|uniref:Sulfurtransferase complex subunit TusB n=1 Tax=Nitrincola tapanii TaxID=1708751 RepID=A0A5A9W5S7_9GAMM|nr:sulfurtransferase complex subunit TusB [Nitrincola tapanii]KAA0875448.1 sulfurtransferase complex subunit TusB [Nitrincola tapanii]